MASLCQVAKKESFACQMSLPIGGYGTGFFTCDQIHGKRNDAHRKQAETNIPKEKDMNVDKQSEIELEAATFRRLLKHLDDNKDVQNIDLMILAKFCRNCLSKWYLAEAQEKGLELDYEQACEKVYGMPYAQWKAEHQLAATPEQLAAIHEHHK